ncbi:MAG: hypothetical protein MUF83_11345 [Acidimicrobiales bacterium]|jgi:hypothetical protein|nr:hypothetical protein [Acidimicrobiales bacterium]
MSRGVIAVLGLLVLSSTALVQSVDAASVPGHAPTTGGGVDGDSPYVFVRELAGSASGGSASAMGGSGSDWRCGYFPVVSAGGDTGWGAASTTAAAPEKGMPYLLECRDSTGAVVYSELLVFDPGNPIGTLFAAQRAADEAYKRLVLPLPSITTSPPLGKPQLVGVPTWLWLGSWESASASASLAGVTSTVTAVPQSVSWTTGDGAQVTCSGPGTSYDFSRPAASQSTDCRHVYTRRSTASGPDGTYTLTATVTWTVSWQATNGEAGDLGTLTSTASTSVQVLEAQAVIT